MTDVTLRDIVVPEGYRSREVALLVAMLDDQLKLLNQDTRGVTPDELQWQPAPGYNTIGMLLAHLAIVEVWWTELVLNDNPKPVIEDVLKFGEDDDGMPLPEGRTPPANLDGKAIGFYDDLLDRARAYLKRSVHGLEDAKLDQKIARTRPNGEQRLITRRWALYHILEHFSGHYGQILLIRHQYRARKAAEAGATAA